MTASVLPALSGPPTPLDAPPQRQRVSVVVPCYNEADSLTNLAAGLARLRAAVADDYELQIVLVDDGSRDGTWDLMQDLFPGEAAVRLVRHDTNRGITAAIATGIREATADLVASLDADCTYEPTQL